MHVTGHSERSNKLKDFVIPAARVACSGEQTNTNVDAQAAALFLEGGEDQSPSNWDLRKIELVRVDFSALAATLSVVSTKQSAACQSRRGWILESNQRSQRCLRGSLKWRTSTTKGKKFYYRRLVRHAINNLRNSWLRAAIGSLLPR